jgi:exodeoxyribonuclease VII small subunit
MTGNLTFEKAIEELEGIVKKLEEGKISLDESLKLFERGMELSQFCTDKLKDVEKRIEMLVKDASGMKTEPFEEQGEK